MIDQQELLELMQAKKILDSQQNVHRNKGIGRSPEASQVQSPWRDSGVQRASITPFESNECNDEIMESQLLPPDLLSCDDDSSPKNHINDQISCFNSDSTAASGDCFAKLQQDNAPESRKQNEAAETFAEQVRVSSFDPCCSVGGKAQIREFQLQGGEPSAAANQAEVHDESNVASKYNSIFSECLFSQQHPAEKQTGECEHPSSIFSMLDES